MAWFLGFKVPEPSLTTSRKPAEPYLLWTMNGRWTKVVVWERPVGFADNTVLGPFRSEVDAEETCDRLNGLSTRPYNADLVDGLGFSEQEEEAGDEF